MSFLNDIRDPYDCLKCFNDVRVLGAPAVKVGEQFWHTQCFTCKICNENVRSEYHLVDGLLLCPEHFDIRSGGFCQKCFGNLGESASVSCPVGKFHLKCLSCAICDDDFGPDDYAVPLEGTAFTHLSCLKCCVCSADKGQFALGLKSTPRLVRCRTCHDSGRLPLSRDDGSFKRKSMAEEPSYMQMFDGPKLSSFGGVIAEAPSSHLDEHGAAVPEVVRACVHFLLDPRALQEEGIFRVPGNASDYNHFYDLFSKGETVDFVANNVSYATATGVLKMALRDHLFDSAAASAIEEAMKSYNTGHTDMAKRQLSDVNHYMSLGYLTFLFLEIVNEPGNKMSLFNLSTSLGLSLFPSLPMKKTLEILGFLTKNHTHLFPSMTRERESLLEAAHDRSAMSVVSF